MPKRSIEMLIPLSLEETRRRIMTCADPYRFDPLSPSRVAGKRPFIVEVRGRQIAVSRRNWLPDLYGLEAAVELEAVPPNVTQLRGTVRIPTARQVVSAVLLAVFIGFPLLALTQPGVDRGGTLAMIAISFTFLVVLPVALRWYRRDQERLVEFLRACLPELLGP
jgi:hypothetical protein